MAFGARISLVSRDGYRVAPETFVQPLVLHVDFAPPFEKALKVQILVGSDGGAPYRSEWEHPAPAIATTFGQVTRAEIPDAHEAAMAMLGVPDEQT